MNESENSWLSEISSKSKPAIRDSLESLSHYANHLQIVIQKTDEYIYALEKLLKDKSTPKREVILLTNKLLEIKSQKSRIHEEARQIDDFLRNSGY